jgi:hypothetical protein
VAKEKNQSWDQCEGARKVGVRMMFGKNLLAVFLAVLGESDDGKMPIPTDQLNRVKKNAGDFRRPALSDRRERSA